MKLFTCDKTCSCGLFSKMLVRLMEMGIEPSIHDDDPEQIHFEFNKPHCGTILEERRFNLDLFQGVVDDRRPCIVCCSRGYDDTQERMCEKCGELLIVCQQCYEHGRMALANCPFCKVIAQDEVNSSKWKSKSIKDLIPELLASHQTGMNISRLTKTLESICGRKLDKEEINKTLGNLVKEGMIIKKGRQSYRLN